MTRRSVWGQKRIGGRGGRHGGFDWPNWRGRDIAVNETLIFLIVKAGLESVVTSFRKVAKLNFLNSYEVDFLI